jgi:hypothetical protein
MKRLLGNILAVVRHECASRERLTGKPASLTIYEGAR